MVIHVHLYENGKFEDIEGDIKDCASRWCQAKHGRDSDAPTLIAALQEANEKIARLETSVRGHHAAILFALDNAERLAKEHLIEIKSIRGRILL